MYEIELKAAVKDYVSLEKKLDQRYQKAGDFNKKDYYFTIPGKNDWYRLRVQNNRNIVTVKDKTIENGIEVNKEIEFEVDNEQNFITFAEMIGSDLDIIKYKKGSLYVHEGFNIEFCNVDQLGWYLEIEMVTDDKSNLQAVKRRLLDFLKELEIDESSIEPKLYIDMLKELK